MYSVRLTSSFSNLAFRLLCTSRLPSFFAYQIEANITTGEITRSGLQSQRKWLKLLSICTECSLSADCSIEAGAKKKKEGGSRDRMMLKGGESLHSRVRSILATKGHEGGIKERHTERTGSTNQWFPPGKQHLRDPETCIAFVSSFLSIPATFFQPLLPLLPGESTVSVTWLRLRLRIRKIKSTLLSGESTVYILISVSP